MHGLEQCHFEKSFSVINKALGVAEMIRLYKLSQSENRQEGKKVMWDNHSYANAQLSLILGLAMSFSNSVYTCSF